MISKVKHFLLSIRGRLIVGVILLHAVMMGIFVYDFIARQRQFMHDESMYKARKLTHLVASNISFGLLNNDIVAMNEQIQQIKNFPDVDMIFVMDKRYIIRATDKIEYVNKAFGDPISVSIQKYLDASPTKTTQKTHNGILDTTSPILIDSHVIGYVRMISTMDSINTQIDALLNRGLMYIFIAIVLGGVIGWFIVRNLTHHLNLLSRAAIKVAKGNYEIHLPAFKNNDDISNMGRAFALMIDSIHTHISELSMEITKRKEVEAILDYKANYDSLTNLPNRVLFLDRLDHAIEKAKRQNTQMAILFIDLDRFKEINDSLGHEVGDKLLILVAKMMSDSLEKTDTVSRLGGDEFMLIIEDIETLEEAAIVASNIISMLQAPLKIDDHRLYISCSIGICIYPLNGDDAQSLLRNADSAMYKAKDEGRDTYQYYTQELTDKALRRVALESNLRRGIKNQEFVVYYQPKVNGNTGELIGMEALVRWQDPSLGMISPAEFIPLAEETGLIIAIDQFVMKEALNQIVQWRTEGLNPGILSLNLAMKQLWKQDFFETMRTLLEESGCQAQWIELEVTEGEIMKNPAKAIEILQQLSDFGIRLAIDDFGTGYSSLAYLKRLPVDVLKIDQSFVNDIPNDEEDVAIVHAVIALAKSMNLEVIAEGVETIEQKNFLVESGCSHIQGYFYSRPISATDMSRWMRSR